MELKASMRDDDDEQRRTTRRWIVILTTLFFILSALPILLLFVPFVAQWFGLSPYTLEGQTIPLYLPYIILFSLVCLIVGILRGRFTGQAGPAASAGCQASALGSFLAFCILPCILTTAGAGVGRAIFYYGFIALVAIGFQVLLAVVFGVLGGLLGSRLLRQRAQPEEEKPASA